MRGCTCKLAAAGLLFVTSVVVDQGATAATSEEMSRFASLQRRPIHLFTNSDLAEYLNLREKCDPEAPPWTRVAELARQTQGQPYKLGAGMFNLSCGDCVTFVERTLAAACASDWRTYWLLANRLRHEEGRIDFLERNFFTLADWVPNNSWLLQDVTRTLGETQEFEYTVFRKQFYANLRFGQDETPAGRAKAERQAAKVSSVPEKETREDCYLPVSELAEALPLFREGDIALIIRERSSPGLKPWLECDHVGIILLAPESREPLFCSSVPRGARSESLLQFTRRFPFVKGLKVVRLRADAVPQVEQAISEMESSALVVPSPMELDKK